VVPADLFVLSYGPAQPQPRDHGLYCIPSGTDTFSAWLSNIVTFQSSSKLFSQSAAATQHHLFVKTEQYTLRKILWRGDLERLQLRKWTGMMRNPTAVPRTSPSASPLPLAAGRHTGVFSPPSLRQTDACPHLAAHAGQTKREANNRKAISLPFLLDHMPLPSRRDLSYSAKPLVLLSLPNPWRAKQSCISKTNSVLGEYFWLKPALPI